MTGLTTFDSALGAVQAAFDAEGALIYLGFADHEFRTRLLAKVAALDPVPPSPDVVTRLQSELAEYAAGTRRAFTVPVRLHGTAFEQRVWRGLLEIPYGETRSYGQLAAALGDPRLSRAVGRANGANPVSVLVPCHRVVGASGALTGYAGGLARKDRLLALEGGRPAGTR